jgi:hypothetical protein
LPGLGTFLETVGVLNILGNQVQCVVSYVFRGISFIQMFLDCWDSFASVI